MAERDPQLTLNLFSVVQHDFTRYVVGPNATAVAAVQAWGAGLGPRVVYLWGASGSGKSHLLQAAVRAAGERGARAMYAPLAELRALGPGVLDGLERIAAVALDDVDGVAGDGAWEERLFALYNALGDRDARLLWSGRCGPATAGFVLDDLRSRLTASLAFQLRELDDTAKAAVLADAARARGFELPPAVLEFILRRARRDLGGLMGVLDKLDRASLSHGRVLTIPFVREVLQDFKR